MLSSGVCISCAPAKILKLAEKSLYLRWKVFPRNTDKNVSDLKIDMEIYLINCFPHVNDH